MRCSTRVNGIAALPAAIHDLVILGLTRFLRDQSEGLPEPRLKQVNLHKILDLFHAEKSESITGLALWACFTEGTRTVRPLI